MKWNKGLTTTTSTTWNTPIFLFDKLNKEFEFTLDPCSTIKSAKCVTFYTKKENGLNQDWEGHSVFMNPPYGREIKEWVKKAYNESLKANTIVVGLIPARTDTRYWHEYIFNKAFDIRFLKGRLKFEKANGTTIGPAPFPSAIIIWSSDKNIKKEQK